MAYSARSECLSHGVEGGRAKRKTLPLNNFGAQQFAEVPGGEPVTLSHAVAQAMRVWLIEQRGANIIGAGYDRDRVATGNLRRDRIKVDRESPAVTGASISKHAKEMMRAKAARHGRFVSGGLISFQAAAALSPAPEFPPRPRKC